MNLYEKIIATYPELEIKDGIDNFASGKIIELRDDGDGIQYIKTWNYEKPIPTGLKLGK